MNILVLGNGFDLAHGLPTKYRDFLDFCMKTRKIYTWVGTYDEYVRNYLSDNKLSRTMKGILKRAFRSRRLLRKDITDDTYNCTTDNQYLNEFFCLIEKNIWIKYFYECSSCIGETWIDFETEISRVVQIIDEAMRVVEKEEALEDMMTWKIKIIRDIFNKIEKKSDLSMGIREMFFDIKETREFVNLLEKELDKLIRALEIYLAEFVGRIEVTKYSKDILEIRPEHVLCFNYTNTYEENYEKNIEVDYDYIHGRAEVNNTIETNNMVLGIDEYLSEDRRNKDVEFIAFKKFYQRIYKGTGCKYKEWIEQIEKEYLEYLQKQEEAYARKHQYETDSMRKMMNKLVASAIRDEKCTMHNVYIFGHSLDVTDGDILRDLILHDNVHTTIFYHNKDVMGQQIANLVKVIGPDELIKRTGGSTKTIEFKSQQGMVSNYL